jgi:hypothetical protein
MLEIPQDTYLSHMSSGRIRLKIPSKKGDEALFSEMKTWLSGVPGVERVEINPSTGSVLIIHSLNQEMVGEFIKTYNLSPLQNKKSNLPQSFNFHRELTSAFDTLDHQVKGHTGGGVNIGALAFLALVGAGTYQIAKGNFAAIPWYTAFWYALNLFLKSKPDGNGGGE